jgi:putative FmdB family regulatory protein
MAVYEYKCKDCQTLLVHTSPMEKGPVLAQCSACSGENIERIFSPVGISFKGTGFYSTDK